MFIAPTSTQMSEAPKERHNHFAPPELEVKGMRVSYKHSVPNGTQCSSVDVRLRLRRLMCGRSLTFRSWYLISDGATPHRSNHRGVAHELFFACRKAIGLPHIGRHSRKTLSRSATNSTLGYSVTNENCLSAHERKPSVYLKIENPAKIICTSTPGLNVAR
jgi:hypothetical protein